MNNIATLFNSSDLVYDRIVTDQFTLPFQWEDVKIQPNELAVSSSFNLKIDKLYQNMLYLYGLCHVSDFNFPAFYTGWAGLTGTLTMRPSAFKLQLFSTSRPLSTAVRFASGGTTLQNIDNSYLAVSYKNGDQNNIALANATSVSLLNFTVNNNPTLVLNQTLVDPVSGSLTFQRITGLAVDGNNTLFVSDRILNNVYSYDLLEVSGDDYVKTQYLFMKAFVGGDGGKFEPLKFNNVGKIAFTGTYLIVEDTGNSCFKIYDRNLVWHNTIVAKSLFNSASAFNALAYSEYYDNLYGCTDRKVFIINFLNNYSSISSTSIDLNNILSSDERIIDIKFANYEPQIFYLLTNKRIIKKWTTKPTYNIGVYQNSQLPFYSWLVSQPGSSLVDTLYVLSTSQSLSSNKIVIYQDGLNLISLLSNNFNVYDSIDIEIDSNEYAQSWVYTKSLQKMLYNMLTMVKNVGYRFFQGLDNTNTPVLIKKGYNDFVLSYTQPDVNTAVSIGINENFQEATLNRGLYEIYKLQEKLLQTIINNDYVITNLAPRLIT